MPLALADVTAAVGRYAGLLHRVAGDGHHVASPLGAWLLLALCGPASSGGTRADLAEALGCDVDQAAAAAGEPLSAPHPLASAALAALLGTDPAFCRAKQAAMARYSRTGFEAAAVTAMAVAAAMRLGRPGLRRTAELRFGHPYAAVAVTADPERRSGRTAKGASPWHGLPVFSAWITQPEEPGV